MSKAEDRASELHILMWDTDFYNGFVKGYDQAEKDLELTCDDICEILEIREDVLEMDSYENLYEEILKRFKAMKETKD